ncbi:MAG: DUF4133 domain-containing protein [Sphingobacterium sp.]|nr:DUF4133 domain-containing protein [Sphingobacterium sp.]
MKYSINKGIGRTVEFKGLKAQYLFIFSGGLLSTLIFVMILYMIGVSSYVCLFIGLAVISIVVWKTFSLNAKYGEHGIMKLSCKKRHPQYIVRRKSVKSLLFHKNPKK